MLRASLRLPRACCKGFQPPAHSFLWPQTALPHFMLSNPIPCSPPVAALRARLGRAEADALLDRAARGLAFPCAPQLHCCWGWPRAGGTVESVPVPPDTGASPVQPHCAAKGWEAIARLLPVPLWQQVAAWAACCPSTWATSEAIFSTCLDQAWSLWCWRGRCSSPYRWRGGVSAPAPGF